MPSPEPITNCIPPLLFCIQRHDAVLFGSLSSAARLLQRQKAQDRRAPAVAVDAEVALFALPQLGSPEEAIECINDLARAAIVRIGRKPTLRSVPERE